MNKERCNELNFSFVRGLGSVVSEKCEKATNIEILMKAASVVAIAVWLHSPLLKWLFNLTKGMVKGIGSRIVVLFVYWICLISLPSVFGFASTREKRCGERNVLIEEECGRQR